MLFTDVPNIVKLQLTSTAMNHLKNTHTNQLISHQVRHTESSLFSLTLDSACLIFIYIYRLGILKIHISEQNKSLLSLKSNS